MILDSNQNLINKRHVKDLKQAKKVDLMTKYNLVKSESRERNATTVNSK